MSSEPGRGHELPLLLLMAFRVIIDEVHAELAREGHPELRPLHGFVFQAIGPQGTTAVELGRRLGVSKQAAGKTIESLERLGYVERGSDRMDRRRKVVRLTARGTDALARSSVAFDRMREQWAARLGQERLEGLEGDLRRLAPEDFFRLDAPGWFGSI